jgi:hypothetical protein
MHAPVPPLVPPPSQLPVALHAAQGAHCAPQKFALQESQTPVPAQGGGGAERARRR